MGLIVLQHWAGLRRHATVCMFMNYTFSITHAKPELKLHMQAQSEYDQKIQQSHTADQPTAP